MTKGLHTRRQFLGKSMLGVAPLIVPSGVLGLQGRAGANSRIRLAQIGVGQRGHVLLDHIKENVVALCDVDSEHLKRAANKIGPHAQLFSDYREVLSQADIDGVVIATPDHWHALQAIHACQAGKDVFIEKPAVKSIDEAMQVQKAAQRWGSIVHVGSRTPQQGAVLHARALIQSGALGAINQVHCWAPPNVAGGEAKHYGPVPENLDWEQWLGPAPYHPYNSTCAHVNHRWLLRYGGGMVKFIGADCFDAALDCLDRKLDQTVQVEATGEAPASGLWDCPITMNARLQWEDGFNLQWTQAPKQSDTPALGVRFEGESGTLSLGLCGTDKVTLSSETIDVGEYSGAPAREPVSVWMDAIRNRAQSTSLIERGCRAAQVGSLINVAYTLARPLTYSPDEHGFMDDELANRHLKQAGRGPWRS